MTTPEHRTALNLVGVRPDLVAVVQYALEICPQPFCVFEGLRTRERQRALVSMGASKTMESKHITGDAVDLVPVVDGKLSWTWEHIYPIAQAMRTAAQVKNVRIRWGGTWDTINETTSPPKELVAWHVQERKESGRQAFIDGPHFEVQDDT